MTVQWKTSSVPSGRKTWRGQLRRWRSLKLQECKRHLCTYHWTECDAAILKEQETIFGLFFFFLWHIMSCFVKGGTQDLQMVEEFFFSNLFLHCNFQTLFLPLKQWALFKKKMSEIWVNHSQVNSHIWDNGTVYERMNDLHKTHSACVPRMRSIVFVFIGLVWVVFV